MLNWFIVQLLNCWEHSSIGVSKCRTVRFNFRMFWQKLLKEMTIQRISLKRCSDHTKTVHKTFFSFLIIFDIYYLNLFNIILILILQNIFFDIKECCITFYWMDRKFFSFIWVSFRSPFFNFYNKYLQFVKKKQVFRDPVFVM